MKARLDIAALAVVFVAGVLPSSGLVGCDAEPVARSANDGGSAEGAAPDVPQWRSVLEDLDGTLLSVWGSSPRDVWTVGGALGNGGEALVLHFDGTIWRRLAVGKTETFWWVHGTSASDVWLVGERGRVTHWNGISFTEILSGTDATLFGVWAAAADDVWAVGGTPDGTNAGNDVVLHWDGTAWNRETLPDTTNAALFKVWGSSSEDVYVVGAAGGIWHRTGGAWKREARELKAGRLTTVAGCGPNEVYAVGGRDLLVSNGTDWRRAAIDPMLLVNDVNGVACMDGHVVVVGGGSLKLRLVDGVWRSDFGSVPYADLHGAWVDSSGVLWGAGGQFNAPLSAGGRRHGVLARFATDVVPSTVAP